MSAAEFPISFTRTRGFAALFEAPSNSYRWSGRGLLRIERRGVHFLAKRRRLGFSWAANRFVPGPHIRDVYREAEGVRVEFRGEAGHAFLKFWAADSATAASIVGLLPTAHTVESEEASPASSARVTRTRQMQILAVIGVIGVLAVGAWLGVKWRHDDTFPARPYGDSVGRAPAAALDKLAAAA